MSGLPSFSRSTAEQSRAPVSGGGRYDWRRQLPRLVAFLPWRRQYEHVNGRAGFVMHVLDRFMCGTILDVGAGRNATVFRDRYGAAYHPLDIGDSYHIAATHDAARPAATVDLERARLPYEDRSFDTVLCTDVLKHIDAIYHAHEELFRVARRHVVISLPNNWVGFPISFIAGRNVTHVAGYGLPAQPKGIGERHKYFFNFEEAAEFLADRTPKHFRIAWFGARFEFGTDGLLCGIRPISLLVRAIEMHRFWSLARRKYGSVIGALVMAIGFPVYLVIRPIDLAVSALLWGIGRRTRFYNLFCRQVWAVFERIEANTIPSSRQ